MKTEALSLAPAPPSLVYSSASYPNTQRAQQLSAPQHEHSAEHGKSTTFLTRAGGRFTWSFLGQMLGWGSLIVAAGVSYYFAKRTINERRQMQEAAGKRPSEKLDCTSLIPSRGVTFLSGGS